MHNKKILIVIWISVFLISGAVYVLGFSSAKDRNVDGIYTDDIYTKESIVEDTASEKASEVITQTCGTEETLIYVYVCGYVSNPGVYELSYGARMYEAVDMAGGVLSEGCADYLNMAGVVNDGDRIYVPSYDEAVRTEVNTNNAAKALGKVNINTADRQELMTLSGIGEAKADAIINYRNESGGFLVIEDIMKIPGIKENAFSRIKDDICV